MTHQWVVKVVLWLIPSPPAVKVGLQPKKSVFKNPQGSTSKTQNTLDVMIFSQCLLVILMCVC